MHSLLIILIVSFVDYLEHTRQILDKDKEKK